MKNFARVFALLVSALGAGCSSFQKKWDAVGAPGKYEHASRWDGRWTSAHHKGAGGEPEGGRLRCVVEPHGAQFTAHFHANWAAFSADYTVPFAPKAGDGKKHQPMEFSGAHELPKIFGGTYHYDAEMARDRFTARYSSTYDTGTFALTRQLTTATRIH